MKNVLLALTVIAGTLLVLPARAQEASFGYADNGLSLKGIPKTFVKPSAGVKSNNGSSSKVLKMRGIEALGELKYRDAINHFKQALAATNDPTEKGELKQYLFTALKIGGNTNAGTFPNEAVAMLNQAITMKSNDYFLHARKGDAYCNMGKLAQCIASHKISIKLNPDKADAVSRLAFALAKIDPVRSAKAFDLSAEISRKQGDLDRAKKTLATKAAFGF